MGRFSNVLLASDFDHTLTDMSGQIPARNLEAIAAFQAEGGIFTVASGRSIPMFRKNIVIRDNNDKDLGTFVIRKNNEATIK